MMHVFCVTVTQKTMRPSWSNSALSWVSTTRRLANPRLRMTEREQAHRKSPLPVTLLCRPPQREIECGPAYDCSLDSAIENRCNWTRIGKVSYGENCSDFFLAVNDRNRGPTEIGGAQFLTFNIENR